jgi:hypothetical protein
MGLAKLDSYDYTLYNGTIRIYVAGTNDPSLVDILSDISRAEGKIYVEGEYYLYLDNYRLIKDGRQTYMEIDVERIA